jgi:hypothetical protein
MQLMNLLGFNVINSELLSRYVLNLMLAVFLIRGIYYTNYKRSDLFLTFFSFNNIIFFVSFMLNKVELSTGAAFGLFAVFSILRYRTEGISAKDMTYLFLNIAIGLLTAVSTGNILDISLIGAMILFITFILESNFFLEKESAKVIQYDDIKLIHEDQKDLLLEDLKKRTGLEVKRFIINEIDFLKDCCTITIYYFEK